MKLNHLQFRDCIDIDSKHISIYKIKYQQVVSSRLTYLSGIGAGGGGNSAGGGGNGTASTLLLVSDWTEELIIHATAIKNNVVRWIIFRQSGRCIEAAGGRCSGRVAWEACRGAPILSWSDLD
jgi:hypothetical protein